MIGKSFVSRKWVCSDGSAWETLEEALEQEDILLLAAILQDIQNVYLSQKQAEIIAKELLKKQIVKLCREE